ncbi:hypothetical protein HPB47_020379 [Ixodes persulcatus]|uniref:Uncharacterized protein n=1 Tax=Ixodes persulcatus TaxID=34615 RepID=A0AC60QHJ5_IXOPE|nr:hypothetical protein HPB47_020379 [Ixodes persulcatus]
MLAAPALTPPTSMDTKEIATEQDWKVVGAPNQRFEEHISLIIKLTDGTDLSKLPPDAIRQSLLQAAALTTAEKRDTYVKVRAIPNLIAIDTYRTTAAEKFLHLRQILVLNKQHPILAYKTSGNNTVKGVTHGIQMSVPDEDIQHELEIQGTKVIQARRIGSSHSVLIVMEGTRLPGFALYSRLVMRLYPYTPRTLFCNSCTTIGHRADVCPDKLHYQRCLQCGTKLPPDPNGIRWKSTIVKSNAKTAAENTRQITHNVQYAKRQTETAEKECAFGAGTNQIYLHA